jgi:aldose 1-epimerase
MARMSEAEQLMPVTLRDERAQIEATFLVGAGMLCCSLCHRGEELLAQNRGVEAYVERGKTMGIPLLYPWANRLAGFDYTIAGRSVTVPHDATRVALDDRGLPIHGVIGARMAWELTSAPASAAQALTARLSWSESRSELFEVFPFHHELRYGARLNGGRLEIEVTVHACGADTVPVAFGFHPYLAPTGAPREHWQVQLPAMRSLTLDERQIPVGPGEELPAQDFKLAEREFDDGFDALPARARFAVEAADRRIALEFLEGYPCAQVYAPSAGQFICFEPMTAPASALCSGAGLRLLAPGESYRAAFAVNCVGHR